MLLGRRAICHNHHRQRQSSDRRSIHWQFRVQALESHDKFV